MSTHDTHGQESYACSDCGKEFTTERGRDSHFEQVHGREYNDGDLLRELYVEQQLSSLDIGNRYGVTDSAVRDALRRHGIEVRTTKESLSVDAAPELKDGDTLRRLYKEQGQTHREVAEQIGCSPGQVHRWRHKHGIEANAPPSGEDHYAWNPDHDPIDYGDNWDEMRDKALEADNHTCQACGADDSGDTLLDVHHIRKIRTFDKPEDANTLDNLVVLCRSCHRRWEGIPLRPQ